MGVDHKGNSIPFIVFVLFLACIQYEFQLSVGCKEQEREALLTFKRGLIDDGGLLSSWGSHDECCEWDGVECSNTTGHVTALRVRGSWVMKGDSYYTYSLRGKIDSALLELHHLNILNLSYIDFEGTPIPEFIGSIKSLQHLDLSDSNFSESIPFHLGNLTNLRTLHLYVHSDNLYWLSRLSFLSVLDLSGSRISDANWAQHVLMLPSLQQLYLRNCMLPDVTKSLFLHNSSSSAKSLSILDLANNYLASSTFHWLFNASLSFATFDFLERLDLSYNNIQGGISKSLGSLTHLQDLDLSYNDLGSTPIPEFIGSIKSLQHLDLSYSYLSGSIPFHLGNLTNLRTLDLSKNRRLHSDNLYWLSRLSLLSYLDLSFTKISNANWVQHVLMLPSLQQLYLRNCMLPDVSKSLFVYNSSSSAKSLSVLDLANNNLTSATFHWLFNASLSFVTFDFLDSLDLSRNKIQGGIPISLRNLTHLQDLNLSYNGLGEALEELLGKLPRTRMVSLRLSNNQHTGSVPTFLGQFSKLETLDLSYNSLEGTLFEAHFIRLHNLEYLDLSFNSLTLDLSPDWIPPFHLQHISLASCKTGPSFPTWLQTQRDVESLDLSDNFISDEVPEWFWNLSSTMFHLNLSHNQMSDIIPDLSSIPLDEIDLSFNKFSGPIPQLLSGIGIVQLSQNNFSGSISFFCKLSTLELSLIDLSNNQLEGALPNCLENMTDLTVLNLNNNNFSGEIPHSLGYLLNLETLHLRGNNLSGELPSTLKNCRNLQLIDIGDNKISGNIPPWMGENYRYVTHLSLRRNSFHGAIPSEICHLNQMQMLDLSGNDLSGKIPQCFNNFTSLVYKNTTTTSSIRIPTLGDGYIDYALVQWKGQDSEYKNTLRLLKLIDLSSNKLVGSIPKAFSSLRGLICLNLSRNSLTGNIDLNIGEMEMLDCLDLSRNQLTGEIPSSLANLHYLGVLDLAYNSLSGKIPTSTQLQSFNESVFAGNYDLCGKPLELCPEDDPRPSSTNEGEKKDEGFWRMSFMQEFGIAMGFGFIVGFWGLVGSLVLKRSWRWSYFKLLDGVGVWLYETSTVCFNKFRRRS